MQTEPRANRKKFTLAALLRDTGGSYAVIFALAIIPILIAIGAAVDLSQAYVAKQRLTSALDAAGLAIAGMTGATDEQLAATAQNYLNANYAISKIGNPGTVKVTKSGNKVNLSATTVVDTAFMGVIGISKLNVGSDVEITRMGKKLEVVLVLDTTGSMASSSKMTTMQTAAKNLIDTVSGSAVTLGDVKIAIVPFSVDVNVGKGNKNATWLKWNWTTPKDQVCTTVGKGRNKYTTCEDASYSISKSAWTGCVADRDMNWDVSERATPPLLGLIALESQFPADIESCESKPLMPLSYDWTTLKNTIDDLTPAGNTNTTIGLVWGAMMLDQGSILSNAAAKATNLNKVMVFLTDGTNTESRFSYDQDEIDARTQLICDNIHDAGIITYTIRVMDGNAALLKSCASSPDKYFSVTNASQLTTVFSSIAQALSNLRVSG